jgi:hypothetical protein
VPAVMKSQPRRTSPNRNGLLREAKSTRMGIEWAPSASPLLAPGGAPAVRVAPGALQAGHSDEHRQQHPKEGGGADHDVRLRTARKAREERRRRCASGRAARAGLGRGWPEDRPWRRLWAAGPAAGRRRARRRAACTGPCGIGRGPGDRPW